MSIASQLSFSTATSLLAGAAGSIPYQASVSNSTFLAIGTNGYVLTSNGSVPTWTNIASGVTSGTATNAINVLTVSTATNASFYPTFVNSNSAAPGAYLSHYTTSTFTINPYTGTVLIGTNTTNANGLLQVNGSIGMGPNTKIRSASNADAAGGLQIYPTQLVVGNNSGSGGYAESGYIAAIANTDGTVMLDVGRGTTTFALGAGRFRVANSSGSDAQFYLGKGTAYTIFGDTSNGNVGIGTNSPGSALDIISTSTTATTYVISSQADLAGGIRITAATNGTNSRVSLILRGSDNIGAGISSGREDSGATWKTFLSFATNNLTGGATTALQEKMRITGDGGIAFGGASNYGTSGQILQSNGNASPTWISTGSLVASNAISVQTVLTATNVNFFPTFVSTNNSTPAALFHYTTSSFAINPNSGNLYVGNATQQLLFSMNSQYSGPSIVPFGSINVLYLGPGGTKTVVGGNSSAYSGTLAVRQISGQPAFTVEDSGATLPWLYVNSTGNVGIGTSSPSYPLHLSSSTGQVYLTSSVGTNYVRYIANNTSGSFQFGIDNSAGSNFFGSTAYGRAIFSDGSYPVGIFTNGSERMRIAAGGNVQIGTTTDSGYKLEVNGSFAATTKSFVIDHPTKPGMRLRYGSLEGPENGVYIRGKLTDSNKILLPEYWTKLVDPDSITVSLTPIGKHQDLYVANIANNVVTVGNGNILSKAINCFYVVYGERADVDKLIVEI